MPRTPRAVVCSLWLSLALSLIGLLSFAPPLFAQASNQYALLRTPTISKTQIAFSYGGDLWIVDRKGGDARRLTSDAGIEIDPIFSPDGTMIAFTGEYDGNEDVYVIPAAGGSPKRLTSHPGPDQVVGWTRDGKRILFRSPRDSYAGFTQLFTIPLAGGLPELVPLPMAFSGSYSPDSSHLAYVPFTNFRESWQFQRGLKHYRGGTASPIWIAKLSDSTTEKVPRTNSNDSTPMWIGNRVFFLSDRDGPVSLYVYDDSSKKVDLALQSDGLDIKSASAGPDAIVYEQFGSLHVFDPATGKQTAVKISVAGDFPAVRPHFVDGADQIQAADISPTGVRAVFEARGEILTVPVEHGDIRDLTNSPGVADRDPAWSPDGKWIAYFSDESGEYALHLSSQDGMGEVRKINLGNPPTFFYGPTWSPDSKKIAYTDKRLNLWYVDVDGGKPVLVDTNAYDGASFSQVWSPDSRWLAYTRQLDSTIHAVFVYGLEDKTKHQVTDGLSDTASPAFDKNGKYLYFYASTDVGPTIAASMGAFKIPVTRSAYVVVLQKDLKSPLGPQSDEEKVASEKSSAPADDCAPPSENKDEKAGADKAAADKKDESKKEEKKDEKAAKADEKSKTPEVKIDFENINQRILALPIPAENYDRMLAGKAHILFLTEGPTVDTGVPTGHIVHKFDLCSRKTDKLLDNIGGFAISSDGEKALYEQLPPPNPMAAGGPPPHGSWAIKPVDALGKPPEPGKPDGTLHTENMKIYVEPRAEWKQMFRDVSRIERDFFYDPNLHGANLKQLVTFYQPFVDNVMNRADLNYIFADMLGEITAQHVYIFGGDRPEVKQVPVGLLGADYTIDHDRYRFAKVYFGENWNPGLRAPLTEPGVNVKQGEYLLAVDGRELHATDDVYSFFFDKAGKEVQLKVGPDPSGKDARVVTVVPIGNERMLRLREWMEGNRRKVDELSGNKLAYVYLPDTGPNGFTNFNRYYFPQNDKQGAVIDERFNGGGWLADYIVDWLSRPLLMAAMTREGKDIVLPQVIFGPKVMLINQYAGSGGDALPWMFRELNIGPLIGTRTWGGLIGIGGYPSLIDGGQITAPRFGLYNPKSGKFDVENIGVSPDIEIDLDPASWRQGKDPQLEKAVSVALTNLKEHPVPEIKRPNYPIYDWQKVRADAAKEKATAKY